MKFDEIKFAQYYFISMFMYLHPDVCMDDNDEFIEAINPFNEPLDIEAIADQIQTDNEDNNMSYEIALNHAPKVLTHVKVYVEKLIGKKIP